jgi:hypothetical protein
MDAEGVKLAKRAATVKVKTDPRRELSKEGLPIGSLSI